MVRIVSDTSTMYSTEQARAAGFEVSPLSVTIAGKTKFTCVDGPEFNAYDVDFDEAMRRQGMYRTQEQRAMAIQREREAGHKCNIGLDK